MDLFMHCSYSLKMTPNCSLGEQHQRFTITLLHVYYISNGMVLVTEKDYETTGCHENYM